MSNYSSSQFNFEDPNSSWSMTYNRIPEGSTVLDIGCSSGNFGKELIERKGCVVDGIEVDESDSKVANRVLRNVYNIDIERDELPKEKYDVIFMGDVIEHLSRPVATLSRLKPLLKKGGRIVYSIPNITHMLVRLMLLKGDIEYGKTGLLDETHLHFYNESEIFRVFNNSGYEVIDTDYVKRDIPIDLLDSELKSVGLRRIGGDFINLAQSTGAATYQFVGSVKQSQNSFIQELPEKSPISINDAYVHALNRKFKDRLVELQNEINLLTIEKEELRSKYHETAMSHSYIIGRKITAPVRKLKRVKRRLAKIYLMSKNISRVKKVIKQKYGLRLVSGYNRPRISLIVRSIEHPTSSAFIRMVSPLSAIVDSDKASAVEIVDGDNPKLASSARVIVVQRTAIIDLDTAKWLVDESKRRKAKLFVDTDDAFGELDVNHPQYRIQKERIDALNHIIDNADEVWFSTERLQRLYSPARSKVVRNTLDSKIWPKLKTKKVTPPTAKEPVRMVYMGTTTHSEDFDMIVPALERLDQEFPGQFQLYVIGVASELKPRSWITPLKPRSGLYPDFVAWFNELPQFDIGLSPLVDNAFNKSKSDIKCLDYLANGIKPIVSDVEAYKNQELNGLIVRVTNAADDWYAILKDEIGKIAISRKQMNARSKKGFAYINKYRSTDFSAKLIKRSIDD